MIHSGFKSLFIVPFLALALTLPAAAEELSDQEYQIKAAFIYNFAQFVNWPSSAESATDPFVIGIVGSDPFGPEIDSLESETLNHRPILIRRFTDAKDVSPDCRIVFINVAESSRIRQTLDELSGRGLLTIGDTPRFADQGGAITFVIRKNKVRFIINRRTAEREGLRMNSQLLSLAERVIS